MDFAEIILLLIFVFGIGCVFCLILRDPLLMLKSLFRGIKSAGYGYMKIILAFIWMPIFVLDKIFKLKIFIEEFEDASKPKKINFKEYQKYISIDSIDTLFIQKVIQSFNDDFDGENFNYSLDGAVLKIGIQGKNTIIQIEKDIDFYSFNNLVNYLENSALQNKLFRVKGILINQKRRAESYFCFPSTSFPGKLIGKTYRNKKMYIDFVHEESGKELIYLNSNIDYFKNFNFDKFESELIRCKFQKMDFLCRTKPEILL